MTVLRVAYVAVLAGALLGLCGATESATFGAARAAMQEESAQGSWWSRRGFEVWIADQSDTRPGYGGQILIYEGDRLYRKNPEQASPAVRLDLGRLKPPC